MTVIRKASSSDVGPNLEFVLSDATVDRMGDIIDPAGWDLKWFKKNPIALFGHSSGEPIGTWADVRVEGKKLMGRLVFAAEGTSARIDELRRLVEQGILRAVSVGFRPLEAEPLDPARPYGPQKYKRQELLETSLVSVPANPAALAVAKSLKISEDVLSLAFGEHADGAGGIVRRGTTGKQAAIPQTPNDQRRECGLPPLPKGYGMTTPLSQRIVDTQTKLVASRDKLAELNAADALDLDAIEELNDHIEGQERVLKALKASEGKLAGAVSDPKPGLPAVNRMPLGFAQREVGGLDLLVRAAVVKGAAYFGEKSVDQVLDERYPGHEATAIVSKAAAPLGTTTTSGFVSQLQQTSYQGFIDALDAKSIYPELRGRGMTLNFDAAGTAYIPGVTAGGANGSFFGEGAPMRVGRITTTATTMTNRKLGVIIPFSREAAERSTPNLENLVKRRIIADTGAIIDGALLDAVAEDSVRPGGLLNGVSAVATGAGGGDYEAVIADINALLAPFDTANASDGIALIMHPAQARKLAMMAGPDGTFGWADRFLSEFTVVKSTRATAGRLIAVRVEDLATALGDAPRFEISTSATVHMEDSDPQPISTAGSPNVVAAPVRSFFQTDTMGVRMVMDINWKMTRAGMVQWVSGTSW